MTLLGFKTILHKKCRSGKNSEDPTENSWCWTYVQQNENIFQKVLPLLALAFYNKKKCLKDGGHLLNVDYVVFYYLVGQVRSVHMKFSLIRRGPNPPLVRVAL